MCPSVRSPLFCVFYTVIPSRSVTFALCRGVLRACSMLFCCVFFRARKSIFLQKGIEFLGNMAITLPYFCWLEVSPRSYAGERELSKLMNTQSLSSVLEELQACVVGCRDLCCYSSTVSCGSYSRRVSVSYGAQGEPWCEGTEEERTRQI